MDIYIRINEPAPEIARAYGYTKNHRLVEMHIVGKWRSVGFYTAKQIERKAYEPHAARKLETNVPMKGPFTFCNVAIK